MRALYERFLSNRESRETGEPSVVLEANADGVPRLFFSEGFALQSASVAFERLDAQRTPSPGGSSPGPLSQFEDEDENEQAEREEVVLGSYLDTVEGALVGQLNRSSDDFFQALTNFQDLSDQVSATVSMVRRLRSRIRSMRCDAVRGVLRVPRLACRQTNLISLQSKLVAMREVKQTCDKVHAAMLAEDYASTVGKIAAAKKTISDHLRDVRSLSHVAKRLDQFYELAISYMGSRWVNFAVASTWTTTRQDNKDERRRLSFSAAETPILELSGGVVAPLVEGLTRSGRMPHILTKFQQRCEEEAREIVNTVVLEYRAAAPTDDGGGGNDEGNARRSGSAPPLQQHQQNGDVSAARLNALSASAFQGCFETCLDHLFTNALAAIALHNFLRDYLDLAAAARDASPNDDDDDDDDGGGGGGGVFAEARARAPAVIRAHLQELKDDDLTTADGLAARSARATRSVAEASCKRMARLIALREEATSKSKLADLKKLWDVGSDFADAVDAATRSRAAASLRRALAVQSKAFLERQHARHKNELVTTLDSEKWQQVDVTPERQRALDRLATGLGSTGGPDAVVVSARELPPTHGRPRKELRGAMVDATSYKVVWSAVRLFEMVDAKLAVANSLPGLAADVVAKLVDLLRFFEARTRQLVLFAGALQSSAQLRTITARQLGLASQCLSLVIALAPHVRAAVAERLDVPSLLADLDAVARDYLDHHNKILSKFVAIIGDKLVEAARSLPKTNWDDSRHHNQAPTDDRRSQFVVDVAKNVVNMHAVLAKLLPREQLQEVFTNIYDLLATKVPHLFEAVNPEMPHGRKRVADDLKYLVSNVAKLDVQATNLKRLDMFIDAKYVSRNKQQA
ncbi:hypothetical protein CTAYLR_002659 [Chrysophaeum taylorii]|uniref:Vacuolar protein sorting-associated protein 54 C-terminal domain-containing protein n=1 Tax=Chrysophaeum taylorii TaxID=2483200 RepID=A0AAD7UDQ1_9STRA|nr:hypothetical protein CTAYLR_002659 [Chrysophaeum taylorii]